MRERGIIFALLTGMGAMTYRSSVSGTAKPAEQVQVAQTATRQVHSSEEELGKTFDAFDKRRTFRITGSTSSCLTAPPINGLQPTDTSLGFDWAIAVVPDPEHSNLKLDFDRDIEAIQLAARKTGYQFERYWLPWHAEPTPPKESSYVIHASSKLTPSTADETVVDPKGDNRESLPGVLLFRNPGPQSLAIFLVSESPTAGIAPQEFRTAVCLGRALANLGKQNDDGHLRVIGPGLSGSLDSLSTLINTQPEPFAEIAVRTWTMDHASHVHFREAIPDAATDNMRYCPREGPTHFHPLLVDTVPAINLFIKYVRENWHDDGPIVLLTEETTAFGAGIRFREDSQEDASTFIAESEPAIEAKSDRGRKEPTYKSGPVYTIAFPRNLSRLRNASEKQDNVPGFGDNSRRAEIPRNGLLMSLRQEGNAALEMPAFSKEQTPLSQESVLFTIGGLLKTGSIHYAGIVATDPLDTLFLTRYLHSASPNVRIFTASPDLMFEHGSDSADYSGIIAVSTYPLFPLSQVWSGARKSLDAFPAETSEAVYNSTLEILEDVPHPPKEGKARAEKALRDLVDPFTFSDEAVWITVAGGSGFEPIAIVDPGKSIDPPQDLLDKQRFPPEYWPGWGYIFSFVLFSSFAFCGLMLFALPYGPRAFAIFASQPEDHGNPLPRAFYLFAMGTCLAVLAAVWLVVPAVVLQMNTPRGDRPKLEAAGFLLFVTGSLTVLVLQFWSARRRAASKARDAHPSLPKEALIDSPPSLAVFGCLLFSAAQFLVTSPVGYQTPILSHLWFFFRVGGFCIGATITASALPFWHLVWPKARAASGRSDLLKRAVAAPYVWGTVAICLLAACLIIFSAWTIAVPSSSDFLAAYRSLDLTNGVSPLVPITLLFIALTILAFVHLRRLDYYKDRRSRLPCMRHDKFCPALDTTVCEIDTAIQSFRLSPVHYLALFLLAIFGLYFLQSPAQTLEARPLEGLMLFAAMSVGAFIVLIWIRLVLVWLAFSEFLQQLERHPIRQVFSLLPRGFMWSPVWQGGGKKRTHVAITRSLECMHALLRRKGTPYYLKEEIRAQLLGMGPASLSGNVRDLLETSA